ncbi:hypothetical protein Celaphus_00012939, partial [Cervus elaphus hippelaphus]
MLLPKRPIPLVPLRGAWPLWIPMTRHCLTHGHELVPCKKPVPVSRSEAPFCCPLHFKLPQMYEPELWVMIIWSKKLLKAQRTFWATCRWLEMGADHRDLQILRKPLQPLPQSGVATAHGKPEPTR